MRRSFMAWKDVPRENSQLRGQKALTFSLQTRQWHEFPLFDEEVSAVLAGGANLLQLLTHELPLHVTDTLGECALDVDREPFGAFDA